MSDTYAARVRSRMICPDCGLRGVTRRMPNGGDCYVCRYCEFDAYVNGDCRRDLEGNAALAVLNPDHPHAPRPPFTYEDADGALWMAETG